MYKPVNAIEVIVWGKTVGAVAIDPGIGYYVFEYAPKFIKLGIELAPVMMPLSSSAEPFVFADIAELTYKRLPGMLADALPDDFGNNLINAWMAAKGVSRDNITALDRLAYMGKRGFGALEFKPARSPAIPRATAIELSELVEGARIAVHGRLGEEHISKTALMQIIQVGTSAGGARAKAAVAWNPKTGEIRCGQFDVAPGFEHWLLKFDGMGPDKELGGTQDYGRIEYAYHLMARATGIEMMDSRLELEGGRAHFMTRRFDRDGNRKHHIQTLCAISHMDYRQKGTHDYSQLFMVIKRLELGYSAIEEAFRRMLFNIMARNCDDHSKNFSFILREGGDWQFAPAYDVTHAYNPEGEWTNQHLMSVNGKFSEISKSDVLELAERFNIGTAEKLLAQVSETVSAWPDFAAKAKLASRQIKSIKADHRFLS